MKNKAQSYTEPGDIETLYYSRSDLRDDGTTFQTIAIAPLSGRETSIILQKQYKVFPSVFIHMCFTEKETDMIINALLEVKNRWETGKVIGS